MKHQATLRPGPEQAERAQRDEAPRSEDGIDLTLIRWMPSLTPEQRLLTLQHNVRSISELRHAAKKWIPCTKQGRRFREWPGA